jgi:mono/diheme cytochrome c family protein
MNKNKHLLLWSSLGALALLITAAWQENFLKTWRHIQASARAESGPLDVRLRQIVVPEIRVTDRCVSCHVGMTPGEQVLGGDLVLAAHKPVVHDPAQFGCTVCHGGQGRATDQADAHGDVPFWPEPLIPMRFAWAGCGTCHTHLHVPSLATLQDGRNLLERYDCLACHRLDGRGGTLRPGGAAAIDGPDLSHVGVTDWNHGWYEEHLKNYEQAASSSKSPWRTSFGPLSDADRKAIEGLLESRVGAPQLIEAKAVFHSLGCRGCHKVRGIGGNDGPDLSSEGEKDPNRLDFSHVPGDRTLANWLAEHFRRPDVVVPGSQMPRLGLSDEKIELLTLTMLSLRHSDFPEAYWPKDRIRAERFGEREFSTDGATLYGAFCAACHGPLGEGRRYPGTTPFPAVANPDFLAAADDEFIAESIRRGRPGRRMPAWGDDEGGLRAEEITAVVGHLRQLGGVPEPEAVHTESRWVRADAAAGGQLFATRCAGCHGPQGEGTEAPALNNRALLETAGDDYLVVTISQGRQGTPMPGFRNPSPAFPVLSPSDVESTVAFIRTWEAPSK